MAFEQVGLESVWKDAGFNAGIKSFQSGISAAGSAADKGASALSAIGNVMRGTLIVGIGAATAAFGAFVAASKMGLDTMVSWQEEVHKLTSQFGMTGEQASAFAEAMQHVGLTVDEGAYGLNYFTRQLDDAGKKTKDGKVQVTPFGDALKKLGVNAYDVHGKLKDFNTIMPEIMDRFKVLPEGINASALAMDLFGARGGSKFIEFLREGSQGLDEARKRAHLLGLDLSTADVEAIEKFTRAMNDTKDGIKGFWTQIGLHLLPIAKQLVDYINSKVLPVLVQWARDTMPKIVAALRQFWSFVDRNILPVLQRLADAFKKGGLAGAFSQLTTEITNAIPAILTALDPLKTQFWNWLTGKGGALEQAGAKLQQIGGAIQDWFKNHGAEIAAKFDELKTAFWNWLTGKGGVIEQIGTKIGEFVTALDKWANGEGQTKLYGAGKSIGTAIGSGISALLGSEETGTNVGVSLDDMVSKSIDIFVKVGTAIGHGIVDGIVIGVQDQWNKIDWLAVFTGKYSPGAAANSQFQKELGDYRKTGAWGNEGKQDGNAFSDGISGGMIFKEPELRNTIISTVDTAATQAQPSISVDGIANGQVLMNGTGQAILNSRGQIVGAITNTIAGGSASAVGTSYGSGYSVGVAYDNGVIAGLWSQSATIGSLIGGLIGGMGVQSHAAGGVAAYTGLHYLHAGERVIPAPSVNNSRATTYNFSHTWNAPVSASTMQMTENMVRQVTHQEIVSIFGKA